MERCIKWASKLFMTKGHTYYCGLIRGPYVGKITANGVLWRNVYSTHIIYKRGCGPHDTTWRAAGLNMPVKVRKMTSG